MVRKTYNSGGNPASVVAHAMEVDLTPQSPPSRKQRRAGVHETQMTSPANTSSGIKTKTNLVNLVDSDSEEADDEEEDEEEAEDEQPAVIAPSVHAGKILNEQAGPTTINGATQNDLSRFIFLQGLDGAVDLDDNSDQVLSSNCADMDVDDDNYDAVNLIGESEGEEEAGIEISETKNVIDVAGQEPSSTGVNNPDLYLLDEDPFMFDASQSVPYSWSDEVDPCATASVMSVDNYPVLEKSTRSFRFGSSEIAVPHRVRTPPQPEQDNDDAAAAPISGPSAGPSLSTEQPAINQQALTPFKLLNPSNDKNDVPSAGNSARHEERLRAATRSDNAGGDVHVDSEDDTYDGEEVDEGSACGNSSGYESDVGETTEEEEVPPHALTRPQEIHRRPEPPTPSTARKGGPFLPVFGSFKRDSRIAAAAIDRNGKNIVVRPAKGPMPDNSPTWGGVLGPWSQSAPVTPTASRRPRLLPFNAGNVPDLNSHLSSNPVFSSSLFGSASVPQKTPMSLPPSPDRAPRFYTIRTPKPGRPTVLPSVENPHDYLVYVSDSFFESEDEIDDEEAKLAMSAFVDFGDDSSDNQDEKAESQPNDQQSGHEKANFDPELGVDNLQAPSSGTTAADVLRRMDKGTLRTFGKGHSSTIGSQMHETQNFALLVDSDVSEDDIAHETLPAPTQRKRKGSESLMPSHELQVPSKRQLVQHL